MKRQRELSSSPEPSSSSQCHRKRASPPASRCNFSIDSIMRQSEPAAVQLMNHQHQHQHHHNHNSQLKWQGFTPSPSASVASVDSADEEDNSSTSDIEPGDIKPLRESSSGNHRQCKSPATINCWPPEKPGIAVMAANKWTGCNESAALEPSSKKVRAGTGSLAGSPQTMGSSSSGSGKYPMSKVVCQLDNKDMWDKFHSLNTEMIITKTGRRMFPVMKVQFHNLDPQAKYAVSMDIVPVDNKRYRYAYHKSCWQVAGKADPSAEPRIYPHPDSPFNGDLLSRQVISFEKVKLTNNEMDKSGHIILNSMHKYQPRIHLVLWRDSQHHNHLGNPSTANHNSDNHLHQPPPPPPTFQLNQETHRTFVFSETVFTAVTAYQNQLITKMKIDKNPFAKGFRDSSRLSDLDRNDPFDYMSSMGPSGHIAAAAAAAQAGSSAAGSAAAAAGAYQLLAASAANNPWYSMAAAASSPFGHPLGPMSAGSAQATAQLFSNPVWLAAAFSACLNGAGGGGAPGTPSAAGSLQSASSPAASHEQ